MDRNFLRLPLCRLTWLLPDRGGAVTLASVALVISCVLTAGAVSAATLADKTADTSPSTDDLMYTLNDPSGTPSDRKVTLGNLMKMLESDLSISIHTNNLPTYFDTAGRSLSSSSTTIDADAELYTDEKMAYVLSPSVTQYVGLLPGFMNDITITYVKCITDTGTATLNIEDGSDNNILTSDIVCDAGGQTSCASGCDVNTISGSYDNITAKSEDIDLDISAVSSATTVGLMIGYTKDD